MAAVIAAAAITLPGCSAAPAPSPAPGVSGGAVDYQAPSAHRLDAQKLARIVQELPPSSPQRSLLRDGTVSRADLDLSWTRLRSCIEAGGLTVKGPIVNPITSTEYLYTYKRQGGASLPTTTAPTTTTSTTEEGGGADDAIVKGCEEKFWIPLSSVYSANTPQHMNSRLAGFMTECMTRAHYPAAGAATFDQIVRDASGTVTTARLREANDCLDRGVLALFPDLPYFPRP
ncbi:hypothetical protein [Pedococcus sp.]|uniref:hypothetical protein n=1 Tax=Pedococcus sp. TaxID=2860345 RepID=UPI002E10FA98